MGTLSEACGYRLQHEGTDGAIAVKHLARVHEMKIFKCVYMDFMNVGMSSVSLLLFS